MRPGLAGRMLAAGIAACGAVAGPSGFASAAAVINVTTTGTDAPGCGATASPCRTIPFAYGLAAAGDTIKVAAGSYPIATPLVIAKAGLRLEGAKAGVDARTRTAGGPGETVITSALSATGDMFVANADSVTIDGFTFEGNARGAGVSTSEHHSGYHVSHDIFADNLKGFAPSSDGAIPAVFDENLYEANNNNTVHLGNQGNGVFTFRPLANARFTRSRFRDNHNAPINIAGGEVPGASKDIIIADNDMDGEFGITLVAVSDLVITRNQMVGGWNGVQVSGACHDIAITHNHMRDKTRGGVLLFTGFAAVTNSGVTIEDNTIEHTATVEGRYGIEISRTTDVTIRRNLIVDSGQGGIGFTARGQDVPSSDAVIAQNTITGSGKPGISIAAGTYAGPMIVRYNRIVDNDPHRGLVNDAATAHIDARLNWWGCNHMPDGPGCDHPAGADAALVAFRPWLILTITSDSLGFFTARHATIRATLRHDSADGTHDGPFFHRVPVAFAASLGTVQHSHAITGALLGAATTWHAGPPGSGTICATIDHQTVCLHVQVTPSGSEIESGAPESSQPGIPEDLTGPEPPVVPVTG